jgi:hypothetical protein
VPEVLVLEVVEAVVSPDPHVGGGSRPVCGVDQEVGPLVDEDHAAAGDRGAEQRAELNRTGEERHEQRAEPDRERHRHQHQEGRLPPVEEHHVEIVRITVVGAMRTGGDGLEVPAADVDRLRVQQVDVDCPLAERIDGKHRCDRDRVSPTRITDQDPGDHEREDSRADRPWRLLAYERPPGTSDRGDVSRMHLLAIRLRRTRPHQPLGPLAPGSSICGSPSGSPVDSEADRERSVGRGTGPRSLSRLAPRAGPAPFPRHVPLSTT